MTPTHPGSRPGTLERVEWLHQGRIRCVSFGKRLDGVSFDGTDPDKVRQAAASMGWTGPIRTAPQVHGIEIDRDGTSGTCDAFLLGAGSAAVVRHADCLPVVFADDTQNRAVLAHCGWRGVELGLHKICLGALISAGSRLEDIQVAVGPNIGPSSFEVGADVLERFPFKARARTSRGTPSIDLARLVVSDLTELGLPPDACQTSKTDTFTDPHWHSHRRDRESAGRNATICIVGPP